MTHADLLTAGLKGVFCGINYPPSALGPQNFATKSNRFWRALHRAGFTDVELSSQQDRRLLQYGYGITASVPRATRRAEELSVAEIRHARPAFEARIRHYAPRAIAFLGKRALAAMLGRSDVPWGLQPEPFASVPTWVLPNPSGR
ncbi:MAG TPA: mismatch-specific DNA-glycosylase, partial [Polyangiales bacterium]|nr:mismatch-specific DNA-glycosylase [Polyangiales bacterium]